MKNIYKSLIFMVIFLNAFCLSIYGLSNEIVYAAPNSINETMSKEEIMDKYYELKKENQELIEKYNKLSGEWSSKKDSIDNRLDKIEMYAGVGLVILTIFGISVFRTIKNINNKIRLVVEKEVNDKVPREVAEKTGDKIKYIQQITKECKKEETLMKEKNILVISKNKEEEKELKDSNLLKQFKYVHYYDYNKLENEANDLNKYDVILFNDINGYFEDKEMNKIIKENKNNKAVYFYFNKRNVRVPNKNKIFICEGNENTNYAKSNSTFIGNLLDLMKYQEYILKDKKH